MAILIGMIGNNDDSPAGIEGTLFSDQPMLPSLIKHGINDVLIWMIKKNGAFINIF